MCSGTLQCSAAALVLPLTCALIDTLTRCSSNSKLPRLRYCMVCDGGIILTAPHSHALPLLPQCLTYVYALPGPSRFVCFLLVTFCVAATAIISWLNRPTVSGETRLQRLVDIPPFLYVPYLNAVVQLLFFCIWSTCHLWPQYRRYGVACSSAATTKVLFADTNGGDSSGGTSTRDSASPARTRWYEDTIGARRFEGRALLAASSGVSAAGAAAASAAIPRGLSGRQRLPSVQEGGSDVEGGSAATPSASSTSLERKRILTSMEGIEMNPHEAEGGAAGNAGGEEATGGAAHETYDMLWTDTFEPGVRDELGSVLSLHQHPLLQFVLASLFLGGVIAVYQFCEWFAHEFQTYDTSRAAQVSSFVLFLVVIFLFQGFMKVRGMGGDTCNGC